jgi:hypothetical protein
LRLLFQQNKGAIQSYLSSTLERPSSLGQLLSRRYFQKGPT